ncbi:nitroreductase family protein [Streptomyces sp. NPDC014891]|uniref:nitroreductase family protein n=1 Tax=Streptomyces sp. NPDC014891 TaxID=3364929 RepID=UPI00370331D4
MNDKASVMEGRPTGRVEADGADDGNAGTVPGPRSADAAVDDALRFWQQMSLAAVPDGVPEPRRIDLPEELHGALALLEASAEGSLHGGPSAPSAGALYPYETYVATNGPHGPRVFSVDVTRRACRLLHEGAQVSDALTRSGLALPTPDRFLVLIAVRPWMSIRKYDDRGYLYAQLDAAHLGTHLLCLAGRSHRRAQWLTRAATGRLGSLLRLDEHHVVPHSVLLVADRVDAGQPSVSAWTCTDWRGVPPVPRAGNGSEERCWRGLLPRLQSPPDHSTEPLPRPLLGGEPADGALPSGSGALADLAPLRRSARDFGDAELPLPRLREALSALGTALDTDLPASGGFGATLVARRVTGLAPGAYPVLGGGELAAEPTGTAHATAEDIVRICMGQEQLRHTCAAVVFHARHQDIFRRGMRGVDEALLRSGALAHLVYLGATATGTAVTTIGGFDAGRWHSLAGLADEDEVLYVAMLGTPGTSTVKIDRLPPAHAHGQR